MARFKGRGIRRYQLPWIIVAIVAALVLFAGLLAVNIAGHAYEKQEYTASTFNQTGPSFPQNFLRGSLINKSNCKPLRIQQGDGKLPSTPVLRD